MATDKYNYENEIQQQGAYIQFSNIQAEDLFLFAVVLDVDRCKENKKAHKIFQQQYRTISLFSMEEIYTGINSSILGNTQTTEIKMNGDLLYQLALVNTWRGVDMNQTVGGNADDLTIKKWAYTTNLGASQIRSSIIQLESQSIDQNNTDNIVILNNLLSKQDQRHYFNRLQGNTLAKTSLAASHDRFKTLTVLKMFFSGSPQKAFPHLRAGQPTIRVQTKFRNPKDLVCYTSNLESYDWNTNLAPEKVGYISTEIFLNEHERILHVNSDAHMLIEQTMNYEQTGLTPKFETNFLHPVKFLYWAVKKDKYMNGSKYLSFDSFADADRSREDFLYDATIRFVQRFASYIASVDYSQVAGFNPAVTPLNTAIAAVAAATVNLADWTSSAQHCALAYNVDVNDVIQSMFSTNQNAVGLLSDGKQLSAEQNTTTMSIDAIFKRLQCQPLVIGGETRFRKDSSFVLSGGSLLSLAEASVPIATWNSHIPSPGTQPHIALKQTGAHVANMMFSQYSQGVITFNHGPQTGPADTFNAVGTVQVSGASLFSVITRNAKFNYGHSDFDIRVMQHDNYGKYLDKSGDQVVTTELFIGQQPRFKKSGFYTSAYHQYQFFPGRCDEGVHVNTFALDVDAIQASGSLNFTKSEGKMTIITDAPEDNNTDHVFVGALVYNVVDYQENTYQLLYATPMNV